MGQQNRGVRNRSFHQDLTLCRCNGEYLFALILPPHLQGAGIVRHHWVNPYDKVVI